MNEIAVSEKTDCLEQEPPKRIKMAYHYHHEDRNFFLLFRKHLEGLRNKISDGSFEALAGATTHEHRKSQFEEAQMIIIFISVDLEFDKQYSNQQIKDDLKSCAAKGAHVWHILAKPYHMGESYFHEFPRLFGNDEAISLAYSNLDEAFSQLAATIDGEVTLMLAREWAKKGDTYSAQSLLEEAISTYDKSLYYIPNYPPALLGKGRVLRKMNRCEEAQEYFKEILRQEKQDQPKGKNTSSYSSKQLDLIRSCYQGHALFELDRIPEAITRFREAYQKINTSDNVVKNMLKEIYAEMYCREGDAHLKLLSQSSNFRDNYDMALTAYLQAHKYNHHNPLYLDKIGQTYTDQGHHLKINGCYEKAFKAYQELTQSHPDYVPGHIGLGNSLCHLRRYPEAINAFEQAIEHDPGNIDAYNRKGLASLASRKPQVALSAFENALSLDPNNAHCHHGRGQALTFLGRYPEALRAYDHPSTDSLHQDADFLVHYAETLLSMGNLASTCGLQTQANHNYEKALKYYHQFSEYGGSDQDYNFGRGKVDLARQSWASALEWFQRALFQPFPKAEVYLAIGKTYVELGDEKEAINNFTSAHQHCRHAESAIDEADVHTAFGDACYRMMQRSYPQVTNNFIEYTRSYYKKANAIREHALAHFGLGNIHALCNHHQEAIDAFDRALALQPRLIECYFLKGKQYYASGQYTEAYSMYQAYKDALKPYFSEIPPQLQGELGHTLLAMRRYRDAIAVFDDIISRAHGIKSLNKVAAWAYHGKALAFHECNREEKALKSLCQAYQLDPPICNQLEYKETLQRVHYTFKRMLYDNPDDVSTYKYIGHASMLMGSYEEARDAYTKAILYGDQSADLYYCRGMAYQECQEYQKAFNDFSEVLNIAPDCQAAKQKKESLASRITDFTSKTEQPHRHFWRRFTHGFTRYDR